MRASTPIPKLTIELVPKTCWYSNVRSNVPQSHWDIIRRNVYSLAGYICEVCGGVGRRHPVECHEVWHYDDINHIQLLERMIALCPACHEVKHIGRAQRIGRLNAALSHLCYVNDWDAETTEHYVAQQFEVWKKRSQYEWKLDIRELSKYVKTGRINTW